jgi:indolepyruvate ferredoxin oxidoreductase alpha subunit
MKQILMGNEAIALGLVHANVDMVSGYPGTPSSEILGGFEKFSKQFGCETYAQWATNEKVGFEVAYAGAIAGKRTCTTLKQVGLNVASDALMSASYIGHLGAMLLVSADDPGFHSSQTEQDSRSFAKFAKIPVFDPATPQEAYDMVKAALDLSQSFETPVMLRPVMRVSHAREICDVDDEVDFKPNKGEFKRDIGRWAAVPPRGRFAQGLEQLKRIDTIAQYNWDTFIEPKTQELKGEDTLCLTSGTGDGYVREAIEELGLSADVLKLDMPYPLPKERLEKLFDDYKTVIVFEETYPCVEEQLSSPKLHGKLTNDVHKIDEFSKDKVIQAFNNVGLINKESPYKNKKYEDELPVRPPNLCPGCPHRDVYYAIMKVFKKKKSIYPSDIGCYTLALNQGAIDTVLCMGASVGMASGFSIADKSKTVIASIGDSTFTHSGVAPLINAVYQKHRFILVIMDNSVTAMTGRQTTPERANPGVIDLKQIAEGCGAVCMEHIYTPNIDESIAFMKEVKKRFEEIEGPLVVVMREFCVLDKERAPQMLPGIYAEVDADKCVACDICTTQYKCPPMHYNEDHKIEIDPFLCIGCDACIGDICPTDAFIERKGK